MKILNAKIENFMVIANGEVKLDDRGLILIQGENDSDPSALSNGSGKSTLVNAICWGLYGQTANGDKGDDVLSTTYAKDCMVKVTIEDDDGEIYYVIRYRNHKDGKNRLRILNESGGDLTKGTDKLTQEFVERLVGCSIDVFLACIYASQENIPNLPAMTDKELKTIVEESAGVNRLTVAYDIARANALSVTTKYDNAVNAAKLKRDAIEDTKNNISDAKNEKRVWDESQAVKIKDLVAKETQISVEITALEMDMRFENERDCNQYYNDEINRTQETINSTANEENINKLIEQRDNKNKEISKFEFERDNAIKLAQNERDLSLSAKDRIGMPCETCGKPYCEEDLDSIISGHRNKMLSAKKEAIEAIEKNKVLSAELATINEQIAKLQAEKPDVSHLVNRINKLNSEKAIHIKAITVYKALISQLEDIKEQLKKLKTEPNPFLALINKNSKTLTEQKKELDALEQTVSELSDKVKIHDLAKSVFSPSGVRNHILTNVTPFLNSRTADYLNKLSDGTINAVWSTTEMTKKGEVRDKFNIVVSKVGKAKSFSLLSGGEKRKVRIATALAVQDLVANRATKDIKLFIGDEIDDALDTAGLERLMGILETKAREKGTVMIISHKEMKSWFRESIVVKLSGDRSVVVDPAISK